MFARGGNEFTHRGEHVHMRRQMRLHANTNTCSLYLAPGQYCTYVIYVTCIVRPRRQVFFYLTAVQP